VEIAADHHIADIQLDQLPFDIFVIPHLLTASTAFSPLYFAPSLLALVLHGLLRDPVLWSTAAVVVASVAVDSSSEDSADTVGILDPSVEVEPFLETIRSVADTHPVDIAAGTPVVRMAAAAFVVAVPSVVGFAIAAASLVLVVALAPVGTLDTVGSVHTVGSVGIAGSVGIVGTVGFVAVALAVGIVGTVAVAAVAVELVSAAADIAAYIVVVAVEEPVVVAVAVVQIVVVAAEIVVVVEIQIAAAVVSAPGELAFSESVVVSVAAPSVVEIVDSVSVPPFALNVLDFQHVPP